MRSDYPLLPFDRNRYPVPHLRVEVVALTVEAGRTKVLMREWRGDPFAGQLILPGGFVRGMASLEDCARDILIYLGGPEEVRLRQFGVFGAPDRDPRGWVVSVGLLALVPFAVMTEAIVFLRDLRLVEVSYDESVRLSTLMIGDYRVRAGFDHEDIIVAALQHVRSTLEVSTHPFELLPQDFTLLELQQVHEALLGGGINQAAFRKRMLARTFPDGSCLAPTGEQAWSNGRPARLYRLTAAQF